MKPLVELEGRLLKGTVCATLFSSLVMLIAICTDHWVYLNLPAPVYKDASQSWLLSHRSGLWRICKTHMSNRTGTEVIEDACRMLLFYPRTEDVKANPEIDNAILDYSRSETAFAMIGLMFQALAIAFSCYALREPRYMFKRLAGTLHIMAAMCIFVTIEVLMNSVAYESEHLPARHPHGSSLSYGFSFYIAWFPFLGYIAAGIVFFLCSRKRKGDKAKSDEEAVENEPIHLGRL